MRAWTARTTGAVAASVLVTVAVGPLGSAGAAAPVTAGVARPAEPDVTAVPSNLIIPLQRTALVNGKVKGVTSARPVQLQFSWGRQWIPQGDAMTDVSGGYSLRIPSGKLGTFTYRVAAPATATVPAVASVPFSVSVGEGNPRSYKLFAPAGRWNGCQVIGYRVNLTGAPKGALDDVKIAIANVARASGLRYAYRGTTTVIPGATRAFLSPYPKDTQLVIAWAKPGTTKHLPKASNYVGYGGWLSVARPARLGSTTYYPITQAFVVVDSTRRMPLGFGMGDPEGLQGTWGQLVMHELGHTVGLTHVSDKSQLMYPYLQHRASAWGLGDLGGLYNLGGRFGCFPVASSPKASVSKKYAGLLAPVAGPAAPLAAWMMASQVPDSGGPDAGALSGPHQVSGGDH